MRKFLRSLRYALRGVGGAWQKQANFRFQVVAGVIVIVLAAYLHFEAWRWSVLLLTIGMVLAGELFNTALEDMWEAQGATWNKVVGRSKDTAAGAVAMAALTAIGVGVVLFWKPVTHLLH